MNLQEFKDALYKLRNAVENYYFDHKERLSEEQKTELNDLYFALQQAAKAFERFLNASERR